MALDALKGEAALDAVADLIDPVFEIAQDEAFKGLFSGLGEGGSKELASRLRKAAPQLIKAHKGAVVRIMAATQGKTEQEVMEGMTVFSLPMWLVSALNDPVLLGFLGSLGETAEAVREQPCGSPSGSTEDPAA